MAKSKKGKRLGFIPAEHKSRAEVFIKQATEKRSELDASLASRDCASAFANLIDLVGYNGMAEAELEGSGESPRDRARHTVRSVRAFREVCKVR